MKAQTKALIASVVVIALALSAVSGVTYSWWSDSQDAEIEVKAGYIELDVEIENTATLTGNGNRSITVNSSPTTTASSASFYLDAGVVSMGDVITITVNKVTIESNINTKYIETYRIVSGDVDLSSKVSVALTGESGGSFTSNQTYPDPATVLTNKQMKITIGDVPMGSTFSIYVTFAAYQANADVPAPSSTVVATKPTGSVTPATTEFTVSAPETSGSSAAPTTTISFSNSRTEGTSTWGSATTVEATTVDQAAVEAQYTINDGDTVLGGIEVVGKDSSGNKVPNFLSGETVTITFTIPGNYVDGSNSLVDTVRIVHGGDSAFTASPTAIYDGTKTTITFTTTAGFSMYYLLGTCSVWDGSSVDAEIFDNNQPVYFITTAAQLAGFAQVVNYGNHLENKTVKLMTDIDLDKKGWTPIGGLDTGVCFMGSFDGNFRTIKNLYVDATTLSMKKEAGVGLFGYIDETHGTATIQNLTIDGAEIGGNHNVGVIAGAFTGHMTKCTVKNAVLYNTHVDDGTNDPASCGDKTGAICGYVQAMSGQKGTITYCSAENCKIYGSRDAGSLFGADTTGAVDTTTCTSQFNIVEYYESGCKDKDKAKNIGSIIGRTA